MSAARFTTFEIERMSGDELLLRGIAEGDPLPTRLVEWNAEMGLIYAVQASGPRSPVKIGYCNAWGLAERLKALQTANPYRLRVLAQADGYLSSEQRSHHALRADRMAGEWFRWSRSVGAFVRGLGSHGVEYAIAAVKAREPRP